MKEYGLFDSREHCLVPMDDFALAMIKKASLSKGGVLMDIWIPRNIRQHKLFFALLNEVIDAGGWDGSKETLLVWVKLATGHAETFIGPSGEVSYAPKSISFGSMPQSEFTPFFDAAIKHLCEKLLHGASEDALRKRILQQVDGGYSALERK